jgi:hypothetical protein
LSSPGGTLLPHGDFFFLSFFFSFLHQAEIKHPPESNFWHPEPQAHGKPPHTMLYWQNLVPFLTSANSKPPAHPLTEQTGLRGRWRKWIPSPWPQQNNDKPH